MSSVRSLAFAVVRKSKDGGHLWIDLRSIGIVREVCSQDIEKSIKDIPDWANNNPVERVSRILVIATESDCPEVIETYEAQSRQKIEDGTWSPWMLIDKGTLEHCKKEMAYFKNAAASDKHCKNTKIEYRIRRIVGVVETINEN